MCVFGGNNYEQESEINLAFLFRLFLCFNFEFYFKLLVIIFGLSYEWLHLLEERRKVSLVNRSVLWMFLAPFTIYGPQRLFIWEPPFSDELAEAITVFARHV